MKTVNPKCPRCSGCECELRFMRDEGLATAHCLSCLRDYLVLDSEDYWFDVIQQGYPRLSRCTCGSTSFRLRIDYYLRADGDVEAIQVWSICSACAKTKRQMSIDIDYSPTKHLIERPLAYCKNPRILYDLKELGLFVTRADVARIVDYLGSEAGCTFIANLWHQGEWIQQDLDLQSVKEAVLSPKCAYSWIYASPDKLTKACQLACETSRQEAAFWKRHEIVRLSSPTHMNIGSTQILLYYLQFSNESVEDEKVIPKSQGFREFTAGLLEWLQTKFVSWRGPHCFDNPDEHLRAFGERFRQKQKRH